MQINQYDNAMNSTEPLLRTNATEIKNLVKELKTQPVFKFRMARLEARERDKE